MSFWTIDSEFGKEVSWHEVNGGIMAQVKFRENFAGIPEITIRQASGSNVVVKFGDPLLPVSWQVEPKCGSKIEGG